MFANSHCLSYNTQLNLRAGNVFLLHKIGFNIQFQSKILRDCSFLPLGNESSSDCSFHFYFINSKSDLKLNPSKFESLPGKLRARKLKHTATSEPANERKLINPLFNITAKCLITRQWITSSPPCSHFYQVTASFLYNLICVTYSKQIDFNELWLFMLSGLNPSLGRWLMPPESPCCKSGCPWIMDVFNQRRTMRRYSMRSRDVQNPQTYHQTITPVFAQTHTYAHSGEKKCLWNNYTFGESTFVWLDDWEDNLSIKELITGKSV